MATCAGAGPSFAQVDLRDLRQRDEILQRQDIDRLTALHARLEAQAARARLDTDLTLRDLRTAVPAAGDGLALRPSLPLPEAPLSSEYDRISAASEARLAASNLRLKAMPLAGRP
ncbi:hypothetical protein CSW58_08200 [Caulobacter sp. B11]|nr:hypothetical protein CSW58_08200 [Caulobacter sp. B11]